MIMNNLDTFAVAYEPNHKIALENNLILNWYPKRILNKVNNKAVYQNQSGAWTLLFNKEFKEHTIIDGQKRLQIILQKQLTNKSYFGSRMV